MNLIETTRQYNSITANGAVTHSTSLNNNLDMFFLAGASRNMSEKDIIKVFIKAKTENPELAYKILFWSRDVRGGAGERRFFQTVAKFLNNNYPELWNQLSIYIPEFGYWKDFFQIEKPNQDSLDFFKHQLEEHKDKNLLAKWFPRKGPWFVAMHKYLKITPKKFRKKLVSMTKVVETQICDRKWTEIEYSKIPSIAMNKYRNIFIKNDFERFKEYINSVANGNSKINASAIFPHQLYQAIMKGDNPAAVEAQWNALPDYMTDSTERIIPVCDVSGSMRGLPLDVSISLGIYISERNNSIFKDAFITFSESPQMNYLKGNLYEKMLQLERANWGMNTNLESTFDLILNSALREKLPTSEMPTKILILSDMEFDDADERNTNLDVIKQKYSESGYIMPQIIFWNLNGRIGNVPAKNTDANVGLVSGFSPSILTSILKGKVQTPEELMLRTINTDRYNIIKVDPF